VSIPNLKIARLVQFDYGNSMYEEIFSPPYNLARRSPPLFNRPLPNLVNI